MYMVCGGAGGVAMGSLHVLLLLWHEKRKKFLKHFIVSIVEFD